MLNKSNKPVNKSKDRGNFTSRENGFIIKNIIEDFEKKLVPPKQPW